MKCKVESDLSIWRKNCVFISCPLKDKFDLFGGFGCAFVPDAFWNGFPPRGKLTEGFFPRFAVANEVTANGCAGASNPTPTMKVDVLPFL